MNYLDVKLHVSLRIAQYPPSPSLKMKQSPALVEKFVWLVSMIKVRSDLCVKLAKTEYLQALQSCWPLSESMAHIGGDCIQSTRTNEQDWKQIH